jgi:adenosylhomocysteine nucleosidase
MGARSLSTIEVRQFAPRSIRLVSRDNPYPFKLSQALPKVCKSALWQESRGPLGAAETDGLRNRTFVSAGREGVFAPTFPNEVLCTTGLLAEARIARAAGFSTVVGAGDRDRTAALVERSVKRANCLVSFGIAGGLAPELRTGDVVISTEVLSEGGRWQAEARFARRVAGLAAEIGAAEGPVLGTSRIMANTDEKHRSWVETGALAVDLESDVVARIATAAGIPFVVVRTIADPAHRGLPPAALIPLAEDGTPQLARVLLSVLRRPRQIAALFGLARETRAALAALVLPAHALYGLVAAA